LQPYGYLLEQDVADVMTVRIVDVLEAVEVHEEQRDGRFRPLRDRERLLRAVIEEETVREPGERVVEREPAQLLVDLAPLADVAEECAERGSLGGPDRRDGELDGERDAVLS